MTDNIIIYSADLHGNINQYIRLFEEAEKVKAVGVIIGGDISPKDPERRSIESQKAFLKEELFPLIRSFNDKNEKKGVHCSVMFILGNDDFKANEEFIKEQQTVIGYKFLHGNKGKIGKFTIIGYPYVPITPFKFKDWEKADLNKEMEWEKRSGYVINGVRSRGDELIPISLDLTDRHDTIEKDLEELLTGKDSSTTILITHSPPLDTSLDLTITGEHVGSAAVRKIIERHQPAITLHGHIHESVEQSGKFKIRIGKTVCMNPGNDPRKEQISVISFPINNPEKAQRLLLDV